MKTWNILLDFYTLFSSWQLPTLCDCSHYPLNIDKIAKALFNPMLCDFGKRTAFWKVSRLCPFVPLATCRSVTVRNIGCNLVQVVRCLSLTAEVRFRSQASPWQICGGRRETETGFSPTTSGFPSQDRHIQDVSMWLVFTVATEFILCEVRSQIEETDGYLNISRRLRNEYRKLDISPMTR